MKTDHMAPSSSADGVVWDLRPLYAATDDEQLGKDLALALDRAVTFETRYRGKVADLDAVGYVTP